MNKPVERKLTVKLTIDPREKIEIERRRDAFAVVIGVNERFDVLFQVNADDRRPALPNMPTKATQKSGGFVPVHVSDRRSGKESGAPSRRQAAGKFEIMIEIGDDRKSLE